MSMHTDTSFLSSFVVFLCGLVLAAPANVCPAKGEEAQTTLGSGDGHEVTAPLQEVAAYDANDLAGTWHVHSLAAGPGAPWWEYGRWVINADHFFSGVIQEYEEGPREMSGRFLLAPNGVATFVGAQQDPDAILFPHLHMAANKTVVAGVGMWPIRAPASTPAPVTTQMFVLIRQDQSYQSADLAGTWYVHALAPDAGAPRWQYGSLAVDADGSFGGILQEYKSGPRGTSGQFQIDPNGVVTTELLPEELIPGLNTGHMACDKNMIVLMGTWATGAPGTAELMILTRKGTDYGVSDLAGRWYLHSLTAGNKSPCWYGPMDVTSDGSSDAPFTEWSSSYPGKWYGQFLIDSDGVVTMAGTTANPDDYQFSTMHLSADKNVMVGIRTWHPQSLGIVGLEVWTRIATPE